MNRLTSADDPVSQSASAVSESWHELHSLRVSMWRVKQQIEKSREQVSAARQLLRLIDDIGTLEPKDRD
jgi:hypothetical protein